MANFAPIGRVKIGRVPFDNSYRHTMTFPSREAQTDYFSSVCTKSILDGTYTYVRMNNAIRVQFNAEELYTYDYVMYQNANYGTKWFYAFIVGVNYVNANCTELVLELDVMQTWYFDYTLKECMVEREHFDEDWIGVSLNPEPEFPFNLVAQNKYTDPDFDDTYAIVQTCATPHYGGDLPWSPQGEPNGNEPVSGGIYSRVVNGAAYYAFDPEDEFSQGTDAPFQSFLRDMNRSGSAEAISNIFQFPSNFIAGAHPHGGGTGSAKDSWAGYRVDTNRNLLPAVKSFARPTSLDGYVPRNNKLFTYPYCFVRVEDNAGHHTEWKYELWGENNQNQKEYSISVPLDPDATAFVVPLRYDGEQANFESALTFPCTAKCSWNYSAYQTWSAQNHLANTFNGLLSVASIAIPAAKGINAASGALGVGMRSASKIASRGGTPAKPTSIIAASAQHGYGQLSDMDKMMLGGGIVSGGNLLSTINRQSKVPDTVRGSASGNSLFGTGAMTYNIKQMVLQNEFARILDDFFDMYGYQTDRVKVPNREGRPYWNYVKCQNSAHRGNVPSDMMSQINDIYDAGITFWHTADVGNYSLDNTI